jgi:hypothetical protein
MPLTSCVIPAPKKRWTRPLKEITPLTIHKNRLYLALELLIVAGAASAWQWTPPEGGELPDLLVEHRRRDLTLYFVIPA